MSHIETIGDVQYLVTDDGTAHRITAEPTVAAPAEPVAASPFALAGVVVGSNGRPVTDDRPEVIRIAAASAPDGKAQEYARRAARLHRVPGFACSADASLNTATGSIMVSAHGYAWAAKSGQPCKSKDCKGTIL